MPGEFVVDASVAAKIYFVEEDSELARAALQAAIRLIAPELLFVEMASIAAKCLRRGTTTREQAALSVRLIAGVVDQAIPLSALAGRAFELAADHGFSAYDGAYLALAEISGLPVLTADLRLARRASEVGLGHLVHLLA